MVYRIPFTARLITVLLVSACCFVGLAWAEGYEQRDLELHSGQSQLIQTSHPFNKIVVANDNIVDVVVNSRQECFIYGKSSGNTSVIFRDDEANKTQIDVIVTPDVTLLKRRIAELFPGQDIKVYSNRTGVVLSGSVTGPEVVEQVLRLSEQVLASMAAPTSDKGAKTASLSKDVTRQTDAADRAGLLAATSDVTIEAKKPQGSSSTGVSGPTITNLLKVSGIQQVLLEVKFAEVNRRSTKELEAGIGLGGLGNDFSGGISGSGSVLTPFDATGLSGVIPGGKIGNIIDGIEIPGLADAPGSLFVNLSGGANVFVNIDNFTLMLRFLEEERLGRILAEPKLVTMTGQEASFLAGGEYPFQEIDNNGNIGIQFKEFGIGLRFTPLVNSDGMITLKVAPSVTDIADLIETSTGPQAVFSSRKLESTVQLRDGQTLALAGLLQDNLSETVSKVPLLGDIPILGTLFRSTNYLQQKTDLLVAVTPHLVTPVREGEISFPGEFIKPPNRFELYLEGRLEGHRSPDQPSALSQHKFTAAPVSSTGGLEGSFGYTEPAHQ